MGEDNFKKWCWGNWSSTCKRVKLEPSLNIICKKILKIKDLILRYKTRTKQGEASYLIWQSFLSYDTKSICNKQIGIHKNQKLMCINLSE